MNYVHCISVSLRRLDNRRIQMKYKEDESKQNNQSSLKDERCSLLPQ